MPGSNSILKKSQDLEDLQRYIEELTVFLPLAFCVANPFNIILGVNQAFQELTGYGEIEAIGSRTKDLFSEKRKTNLFQERIAKENKRISQEMTLVAKNKNKIPVSVSALARKDEKGNYLGYFLTISDISQIKEFQEKLEKEVKERTKELQVKVKELEAFQKLVVARELKMVELKKEMEKLRKEKNNR